MIINFLAKIPTAYKVLLFIVIILSIVIFLRYLTKEKRLKAEAELLRIEEEKKKVVQCTHCGLPNPNDFPVGTEPPQRVCDHCFQFFSKREFSTDNPCVYLDFGTESDEIGRVKIELFRNVVPKTSKNFYKLCCGVINKENGKTYKKFLGMPIHSIAQNTFIQSGDYVNGDGSSGRSIYKGNFFPDENFHLKHEEAGILSMVNNGKDTNNSQFIITCRPTPWLDNKQVVFGKVIDGMDTVQKLSKRMVDMKNKPLEQIYIIDCGAIQ